MVALQEAGADLDDADLTSNLTALLVGGNLTTTDLIGNGVLALLKHPDQPAKLRARPELVPNAVEEILRYDPPVVQTGRVALEPLKIGGTGVRAGEVMTASLLAAGHDSRERRPAAIEHR